MVHPSSSGAPRLVPFRILFPLVLLFLPTYNARTGWLNPTNNAANELPTLSFNPNSLVRIIERANNGRKEGGGAIAQSDTWWQRPTDSPPLPPICSSLARPAADAESRTPTLKSLTSLAEEVLLDDGRAEGGVGGDHEADADRGSLTHSLPSDVACPTIVLGVTAHGAAALRHGVLGAVAFVCSPKAK